MAREQCIDLDGYPVGVHAERAGPGVMGIQRYCGPVGRTKTAARIHPTNLITYARVAALWICVLVNRGDC